MNAPDRPLSILLSPPWSALAAGLDEAARHGGELRAAREALLRPLRLLDLMARDAPAALGDDVAAAERLRFLLHLAAPYGSLVSHVKKLARASGPAERGRVREPGVVDHGVLALVALAAMRVSPPGDAVEALQVVHGAALSAAPVEALGRLSRPHDPDGLATVLGTLYLLDAVGSALAAPFLRPFAGDPAERARWAALAALLEEDLPAAVARAQAKLGARAEPPWDGASADAISRIEPRAARPGEPLTLHGRFHAVVKRGALGKGVRAVLAFPEGVTPLRVEKASPRAIVVTLPRAAPAGWLGLSSDAAIERSNAFRAALREAVGRIDTRGGAVPAERLPLLERPDPDRAGALLAAPPRHGSNAYLGSRRSVAAPGPRSPRLVVVRPLAVEVLDAAAPPRPPVRQGAPPIALRPASVPTGPAALHVEQARVARAVDDDALRAALRASREDGAGVLELPWVDDGLAATLGWVADRDDPRIPDLLEQLARRALLTPGLEDAAWVCLVPSRPGRAGGFWRAEPADAARAVAVADPAGLPALLAHVDRLPPAGPPASRLRLLATLHRESIAIHDARQEVRAAGPGAPRPSGVVAVALDAAGDVLATSPLRVLSPPVEGRPAPVAALVRIAPDVVAVELRRDAAVLHRIERSEARPEVSRARLDPMLDGAPSHLTWTWSGSHPTFELALERGGVATPVLALPDDRSAHVRLTRYAAADRLLVVGCDGWNAAERTVEPSDAEGSAVALRNPFPVAIRRVAHRRYFAQVPEGWSARWSLGSGESFEGLAVRVAERARGTLVLESSSPEGSRRVRDERAVPAEVS